MKTTDNIIFKWNDGTQSPLLRNHYGEPLAIYIAAEWFEYIEIWYASYSLYLNVSI